MIRFAVLTDLHYDFIPDGDRRLEEFMERLNREPLDFIVSLGDLCRPLECNRHILEKLQSRHIPVHYAIGNHDIESSDRETVISFYGLKNDYYSFVLDNTKFIVLNTCYMEQEGKKKLLNRDSYRKGTDIYPVVPEEEIQWLQSEMADTDLKYVILSHHSFHNDWVARGVVNQEKMRGIFETRKTLLCINGHDHGDGCREENGIPYFTVNSMSYFWHGVKEVFTYPEELHEQYPALKSIIMYKDALHAIVEINEEAVNIRGVQGSYQTVSPEDIGLESKWNGVDIIPGVTDYHKKW